MMKRLLIFLLILLAVPVMAIDLNEGVTTTADSQVNLTAGEASFSAAGLTVATSTLIDGQEFVPAETINNGESLTWTTGEKDWFVFPNPSVAITYDYNGTFLKETIVLKEDKELSFPLRIANNSRMIDYNGGFRIIPNQPLSTDKNGGYPEGIVVVQPFGTDALGRHVQMKYNYDGESLSLVYDRTITVYNETLTNEIKDIAISGDMTPQYDVVPITYPLTIDPTYYLDEYSSYLKILLHMNQTAGQPTYFYDSSVNNLTVTPSGSFVTDATNKVFGNASGYSNGIAPSQLSVTPTSALNFGTGNITFSAWIYPRDYGTIGDFVIDTQYSGAKRLYLLYSVTGVLTAEFGGTAITGSVIPLNTWTHVYLTRNATKSYMYVNGVPNGTPQTSPDSFTTASAFKVGARYATSGDYYANASYDDLAVWNTYIPISEIYPQLREIESANPPVATFISNVTSGVAPTIVQFNETSTSTGTSWVWNATNVIGNNTPFTFSTVQNATHPFGLGNYLIKLNSTNAGGSSISAQTTYINVTELSPIANFTSNVTSGFYPLGVLFNDTSTNTPTIWNWSFGDGSVSSLQNNTHLYSSGGNYTVNLTVRNTNTTWSTKIGYIEVWNYTHASFTQSASTGTTPLSVIFTDTSTHATPITASNWSATNVTGNNTPFIFATTTNVTWPFRVGNFRIQHGVATAYDSNISTQVSWVNVSPMVASFSSDKTSGNVPLAVQFYGDSTGSPSTWLWNFGDGNTSTDQNPTHTYVTPGTYTVSLTATATSGDSDTETKASYITASATSTTDLYMDPLPFTLTLTFTDSSTGAVIPVVGVTDNLGYTTSTTVGIYTRAYNVSNMTDGPVVYVTVSATGYTTRQLTYEMTEDVTETVQLTASSTTPQPAIVYIPQQVRIRLVDQNSYPLSGVLIQATPIGFTAPADWAQILFGISSSVNINGTTVYGNTGSDGSWVAPMLPSLEYNIVLTRASDINYTFQIYPQQTEYTFTIPIGLVAVPTSAANIVRYSLTNRSINSTHQYVNMSYIDTSVQGTDTLEFKVFNLSGGVVASASYSGGAANNNNFSQIIPVSQGQSYTYQLSANQTEYGWINQTGVFTLGNKVSIFGGDPGWAEMWIAIAFIVVFSTIFAIFSKAIAMVGMPLLAWFFQFVLGWLPSTFLSTIAFGVMLALGVLIYIRQKENMLS